MNIQKSESGGEYFNELPGNTRTATLEDFYDMRGKLILGLPYIIQSEKNPEIFWKEKVKKGFPFPESDFGLFIERKRVYVFESVL